MRAKPSPGGASKVICWRGSVLLGTSTLVVGITPRPLAVSREHRTVNTGTSDHTGASLSLATVKRITKNIIKKNGM